MSEAGTITVESAAKLLMITARHIQRLVRDGWISKGDSDRYTTVGVVQGYIKSLKDENRRNSATASKNRLDNIKAETAALKLAMLKGTTISMSEAIDAVDRIFGIVKSELTGLPPQITRDHTELVRIEALVDGVLRRAAGRIDEAASGATADAGSADD